MSESIVESYYIDRAQIVRVIGSNDKALLKKTLKDKSGIIASASDSFDEEGIVANAVEQLLAGRPHENEMANAFATWAILAAAANERPEEPTIEPPFVQLDAFVDFWKPNNVNPTFSEVLRSLDGAEGTRFELPIKRAPSPLPCFAYIDKTEFASLHDELLEWIGLVGPLFENGLTGNPEVDENYDVVVIASWILDAEEAGKSLLLVRNGNL